jgi:hypothetical protein
LYESLWNFGLAALLLWIDRRFRMGPGRLFAVYLMGYGAGRFWVEGLRIDPADEIGGLRFNQWVALASIVAGAIWLIATRGQKWSDDLRRDDLIDEPDDEVDGRTWDENGTEFDHDAELGDVPEFDDDTEHLATDAVPTEVVIAADDVDGFGVAGAADSGEISTDDPEHDEQDDRGPTRE